MKSFLHLLLFLSLSTFVAARPNRPWAWGDDDLEPPEPSSTSESDGGPEISHGPTQSAGSAPAAPAPPQASATGTIGKQIKPQGPHDPPVPGRCVLTVGLVEHRPKGNHRRASIWLDMYDHKGKKLENLKWGNDEEWHIDQTHPLEEGGVLVENILGDELGDSLNINWHHPNKRSVKKTRFTMANSKNEDENHHGHPKSHGHNHYDSSPRSDNSDTDDTDNTDDTDTDPGSNYNSHTDSDTDGDGPVAGNGGYLDFSYKYGPRDRKGTTFDWTDKAGDLRCLRGSFDHRSEVSKDTFRVNSCFFDCLLPEELISNDF